MNKLIKLKGVESNEDIYIRPRDVVLLQSSTSIDETVSFYYIAIKEVSRWLRVDAESYFKLKAILDGASK